MKIARSFSGHGGQKNSAQMNQDGVVWKQALVSDGGKAVIGVRRKPEIVASAMIIAKPVCGSCGGTLSPGNTSGICRVCASDRAEDFRTRKQAEKEADPAALARRLEALRRFLATPASVPTVTAVTQ